MEGPSKRSSLQQFSITDFLQWNRQKELTLNPAFQRRAVWTLDAQSYLIDTILLGYSMPKVYLRSTINAKTQTSTRDVVDGQQRLRTIIDYANDEFALNKRSRQFQGMRYSELALEHQEAFLSYQISVEHLINADDKSVLETFSRLNSYTVPLNPAELRHATYDSELKWFVYWITNDLRWFLQRYSIISVRTMVRMDDDAFFAELVNLLTNGIVDSGAAALNTLYRKNTGEIPQDRYGEMIREYIDWLDTTLPMLLVNSPLGRPYQLQILFAAFVHQKYGALPTGRLEHLPERRGLDNPEAIIQRLSSLAQAVESEDAIGPFSDFVEASSATTHRVKSRTVRFLTLSELIAAR